MPLMLLLMHTWLKSPDTVTECTVETVWYPPTANQAYHQMVKLGIVEQREHTVVPRLTTSKNSGRWQRKAHVRQEHHQSRKSARDAAAFLESRFPELLKLLDTVHWGDRGALLTPEIAPRMGIVLFRPGQSWCPCLCRGVSCWSLSRNVFIFRQWCRSGSITTAGGWSSVRAVFRNEAVIRRAGGVECLKAGYFVKKAASGLIPTGTAEHDHNATRAGRNPSVLALRYQLRDQFTNGWNQWQRITVPLDVVCCASGSRFWW